MDNQSKVWPTVSRLERDANSAAESLFLDRVRVLADRFVNRANETGGPDPFKAVEFAYMIVKADRALGAAYRAIDRLDQISNEE